MEADNNDELSGIDEGIHAVVMRLRGAGFQTIASCQGGEGHMFALPMVRAVSLIETLSQLRQRLVVFLIDHHFSGFTVSEVRGYQNTTEEWAQACYVEIVFWDYLEANP